MQSAIGVSTKTSMNSPGSTKAAHHVALGAIGRDERAQHDQSALHHELGDLADAADVLDAVGFGEAEIAVQAVAHIVAVENHGVMAAGMQPLLDEVGDGRLAGAGKPGEPDDRGLLLVQRRALGLADQKRLPVDVGAAAQPERDHAGADGVIGETVDDDEGAGPAVLVVGIEGDRQAGRQVADRDIVELERRCRRDACGY